MTQSSTATVIPAGPAPRSGTPVSAQGRTSEERLAAALDAVRAALAGTPGQLRLLAGLAILAALVVAIGGGAALRERSSALQEARATTQHLVLLQTVRSNIVQADADATNSFLNGGLEPKPQRADYVKKIAAASAGLAQAARSGQDAAALARVNTGLTTYAGYIEAARANNRQNLPVGASYLQAGSDVLRGDDGILQDLDAAIAADGKRVNAAFRRSAHAAWWLAAVVLIGLGGLVVIQVRLAGRSRRVVNLPAAGATLLVVVVLLFAEIAMVTAQGKANDVRSGAFAETRALGTARVNAFEAKSQESLGLIHRGSGAEFEPAWKDAMAAAQDALLQVPDDSIGRALNGYATKHQAIRDADDRGDWDGAVSAAISDKPGDAVDQFNTFADKSEKALDAQAAQTSAGLNDARRLLPWAGVLVVLVGLLAAIAMWWGISLRLEEYR